MNSEATHAPEPTRIHGTALVDIEEVRAPDAQEGSPPKRRRGRPPGTRVQVTHSHVTADEFALLRALAQGVDLSVASRQYLLWPGRLPERAALEKHLSQLLARIRAAAVSLDDGGMATKMVEELAELAVPVEAHLSHQTRDGSPVSTPEPGAETPAPAPLVPIRPSLEEFASRFDEDMFSEAELMEMYEEEYPQQAALPLEGDTVAALPEPKVPVRPHPSDQSFGEKVRLRLQAIDWLDSRLGVRPDRDHPVEQWIRLNTAQRQALNKAGVLSLGNLVDWMALRGDGWFSALPGYGVHRASSLQLWLANSQIEPAQGLKNPSPATGQTLPARAAAAEVSPWDPSTKMDWPPQLSGANGLHRSDRPNAYGANNDLEAVEAWFKIIQQKADATQIVYRRAIERLIRWALGVRGLPLSSLTMQDLMDFKEFLANPPPSWVQEPKTARNTKDANWRPLRNQLNDKSLELTFVAIRSMYKSWRDKGYTTLDPASDIIGSKRKDATMDVMRSFSAQEQEVISRAIDEVKDGPVKRRLVALLWLLLLEGLRRDEVASTSWRQIENMRIDGRDTDQKTLRVLGKGNRERVVPIHPDVYEALLAHRHDREELMEKGVLWRTQTSTVEDMPLIGVLDERWINVLDEKLKEKRKASFPDDSPPALGGMQKQSVNANGALSAAAIYEVLKSFFRKCSDLAGESHKDLNTPFKRASVHWLRHTFAHNALRASGKDLELVKSLLGHKSINTTALYVKAEMAQRAAAINAMKTPK